ncbi:MAG TPA: DUF2520 domain-containing protein [Actinomycetota bacterium]|nr:DUF2520 domain-containing protein [Actinomycetota bacterium]
MDVGVVGAGRVGTALAVLLRRAGHAVVAASGRGRTRERVERFLPGVPLVPPTEAARAAEVVLLAVPDDAIAEACAEVAAAVAPGRAVAHLSGSVGLDALALAGAAGAATLSIHPLQTFPGVEEALERLPGSAVAVTADTDEGRALGERLARDAGGRPFPVEDRWKPLYHAAAVFASNYLVVVLGIAEEAFAAAGLEDPRGAFGPLARASVDNALALGAEAALTGPAARGDRGTIRRNLEALSEHVPGAVPAYVVLARGAAGLARDAGRLDEEGRRRIEEELARWR